MTIRTATSDDAAALCAIYGPIVRDTAISFELEPPNEDEMRRRILDTLHRLPWLVATDANGAVEGYAYASRHRERAAYQWVVEVTAYVHARARGQGVGRRLYTELIRQLAVLGYMQALAVIVLPNVASIALHEAVGFTQAGTFQSIGYKLGRWHDIGWWQMRVQAQPPADPAPPRLSQASGALN